MTSKPTMPTVLPSTVSASAVEEQAGRAVCVVLVAVGDHDDQTGYSEDARTQIQRMRAATELSDQNSQHWSIGRAADNTDDPTDRCRHP